MMLSRLCLIITNHKRDIDTSSHKSNWLSCCTVSSYTKSTLHALYITYEQAVTSACTTARCASLHAGALCATALRPWHSLSPRCCLARPRLEQHGNLRMPPCQRQLARRLAAAAARQRVRAQVPQHLGGVEPAAVCSKHERSHAVRVAHIQRSAMVLAQLHDELVLAPAGQCHERRVAVGVP